MKLCRKCKIPLDGTNKSYCKSCMRLFGRERYRKQHPKKEKDFVKPEKIKQVVIIVDLDQAFCDRLIRRSIERNVYKKIRLETLNRVIGGN